MPFYMNEDGQRLFFEDCGTGSIILFIHPPGMGRKAFLQQHELAEQFRIIVPDLSGHGDSDAVNLSPTIEHYAEEIRHLVDYLKVDQVFVFGYSAGGSVAQQFALRYPEKVKGLILAGAFPKVDTMILKFEFKAGMSRLKQEARSLAKIIAASHFKEPEIRLEVEEHMMKSDRMVWHQFYKNAYHYDCTSRLDELVMPVLLLYGTRPPWINKHLKYYRVLPKASLVVVDHASHQIPATHAPVVNQAVREFFNRTFMKK
ncbi:alpha/beta hydrolase [Halobacillus sp. A1]|uniref:alpha/beta fold hydrolase n=1 Tax=Halobacillus sp. A1 TaxID=2880262 RepID=UPI0020A6244C|nr:alpha/beta hydrolase [Halobacillus sp. A1]MCP3031822.1 alpha/beta hydrolase [Halobacillus sp. A1]